MRLEQFAALQEISKHKSMNIASQILHLSPQALSISIRKLEKELGYTLLERTTMGVSLTEAGKKTIELYQSFSQGIGLLQNEYTGLKRSSLHGHMTLVTPFGFAENLLPSLLTDLYEKNPGLEISTLPCDYDDIYLYVRRKQYEYALTYQVSINGELLNPEANDGFVFHPLFQVDFFARVPKCVPIAQYKHVSLKTLIKNPVVLYEPSASLMMPILTYFGEPTQVIKVPSTNASKELISKGIGVGIGMWEHSHHQALESNNAISYIPFQETIVGQCGYITKQNEPLSESAQAQLAYLKEYFSGSAFLR